MYALELLGYTVAVKYIENDNFDNGFFRTEIRFDEMRAILEISHKL